MSEPYPYAIGILVDHDTPEVFQRCLTSVLAQVPQPQIELRVAFARAPECLNWLLDTYCLDGERLHCYRLPLEVERFDFRADSGMKVWGWYTERYVSREQLGRLLYHGVSVEAEYVVCLEQSVCVEPGWWDAMTARFAQGIDLIGRPAWHEYRPGEADPIAQEDWYMGVPVARRQGRAGVAYVREECFALRADRLREANYPAPGSGSRAAVRLGEMAHQLGWSVAELVQRGEVVMSRQPQMAGGRAIAGPANDDSNHGADAPARSG